MIDPTSAKRAAGTVLMMLNPANCDQFATLLTAHVVPRDLSGSVILNRVQQVGGRYKMITVSGDTLVAVPGGVGVGVGVAS